MDAILDLGFEVYLLSEVRVSTPQQSSLARLLKSRNFTTVFSAPPPASNTFSVPPGGVAICAKNEFTLRKLDVEAIAEWECEGRMVAAHLTCRGRGLVLISVYGYPASHQRRSMNDMMLIQLHNWIASLKMPVLVAGDLNTNILSSSYLSLCHAAGIWRISPDVPSTSNRFGGVSEVMPLDHALVNARMLDWGVRADIRHDICISDHFPVVGRWNVPIERELPILKWPAKMDVSGPMINHVQWVGGSNTYVEWAQKASKWIAETYMVPQQSKTTVTSVDSCAGVPVSG